MRLLVIEDDRLVAQTLKTELESNYIVELAYTGNQGEYLAQINNYDLIILDLGLPGMPGVDVCRSLRSSGVSVPILILTGRLTVGSKVEALDCGADDYLVKPFSIAELQARLRALIRRHHQTPAGTILAVGELVLDLKQRKAFRSGKELKLRHKELALLEYLMRNAGRVVTRDMVLDHVWESGYESANNIIDVHIKHLRSQIDRDFSIKMIQTVRGYGYKLDTERG